MGIGERDWKILKQVKASALERACEAILGELRAASTAAGKTAHERYLAVWDLMNRRDEALASAFDDYRRSTASLRLIALRQGGYLTDEEFSRFSPQTREHVGKVLPALRTRETR